MRKIYLIFILFFTVTISNAQNKQIDSLKTVLKSSPVDTVKLNVLLSLAGNYFYTNPDSCIIYAQQVYELAVKCGLVKKQATALNLLANSYSKTGDYVKSIQFYYKAIRIVESIKDEPAIINYYGNIGTTYVQEHDYKKALYYLQLSKNRWNKYLSTHTVTSIANKEQKAIIAINLGECYLYTNKIDSADYYLKLCYQEAKKYNFSEITENMERDLGEVEIARKNKAAALLHLDTAINVSILVGDVQMLSISYLSMSKLYNTFKQQDSAEYYAGKALEAARSEKYQQDVLNADKVLYTDYDEDNNYAEANKYYRLANAARDSLYSQDKIKQLLSLDFDEKQRQQEIANAQLAYRDQVRIYMLIAGLVILLLLVLIFWRNSRQRQEANKLLQKQKEEIQATLSKLQLTQTQLIQSEKMASLGELTAGIAHEIQNPLNFVNNFSDVNREMVDELEQELKGGNIEEALSIAAGIKQNEEKINHHGKRADFIVKGMLQHSRTSTGERQLTNINILADEFLKLSYHGLRAKDKSFNSELITRFDESLPKANIVQQDIGRVLLNLFNNAFYAVNQKQKSAGADYKPEVTVSTSTEKNNIIIKVKDNGNGIPDAIKDKIMQPFFTTKPTGEGTGLGLSLSYDIVVKGHGGTINVESKEQEYTLFEISLPI